MASWSTSFEQELIQFIRSKGGTQQYPYPSNVNPSGIVSIKLAGKNTYNRWQEQMVCLIESHGMQGFIDGSFKNPKENTFDDDDSQNTEGETILKLYEEWKRSDLLVKGWIFGSLSKKVMSSVVGLPTAMDVWNKLKTTYGPLRGTQQYPYPSHVQPSKFVSMKLSGEHNYCRWQEKMARLIERHGMVGFIDGTFKNPKDMNDDSQNTEGETIKLYEEWKTSDSLVKGWIFGSLNEDVMSTVVGLHTAIDVWKKLNTTYGTSNEGTQQYPYPSHVRSNDFVSTQLYGQNNYNQWREQMVCLIESHGMQGFIDGKFRNPKESIDDDDSQSTDGAETSKYAEWKRSDSLVKGWMFGSLSENVMGIVVGLPIAMDVWNTLNNTYSALTSTNDNEETQQYPYPSHVEPSHFVSIKLSGQENYNQWREQMLCLLESHDMQGFYNGRFNTPEETTKYGEWKRSDSLVKRWIVCSLTENIKGTVIGIPIAMDVWKKLQTTFDNNVNAGTQHYPYPSHVQKPNGFVSIKLSGQNDYCGWQEQMVRLIEINGLHGFIDGRFKKPKDMNGDSQNTETMKLYEEWKRSDSLVKGLIFGSLSEHVMDTVVGLTTAMDVWTKLNITYGTHNKDINVYKYYYYYYYYHYPDGMVLMCHNEWVY